MNNERGTDRTEPYRIPSAREAKSQDAKGAPRRTPLAHQTKEEHAAETPDIPANLPIGNGPPPSRASTPTSPPPSPPAPSKPVASAPEPRVWPGEKESHLSPREGVFDVGSATGERPEGTIVSEKRGKRWSLGEAIGASLAEWVDEKKEVIEDMRAPKKPNVPPAATRRNVIEAAGQKSHIAPRDDHRAVVERLRTFARDAERITGKQYQVQRPTRVREERQKPRWTYTSIEAESAPKPHPGKNEPLTSEGLSGALRPSPIKRARPVVRPQTTTPVAPSYVRSDMLPVADTAGAVAPTATQPSAKEHEAKSADGPSGAPETPAVVPRATADIAPAAMQPTPSERKPRPSSESVEERAPSRDIPFEVPAFEHDETARLRTYRGDAIDDVRARELSVPQIAGAEASRRAERAAPRPAPRAPLPLLLIFGAFALVGVLVGGGVGLYVWMSGDGETPIVEAPLPSLIGTVPQRSIPFSTSRLALLDALAEAAASAGGSGIERIYPETNGVPVSTSVFMDVLDPQAPGAFVRSLGEEMVYGVYLGSGRAPFFIFTTAAFDTAFAGILAWEASMSADLAPLFGEEVTGTLLPGRGGGVSAPRFVDQSVQNVDVRILYDESGRERILYGFRDSHTIIITTSSAAFGALIERL